MKVELTPEQEDELILWMDCCGEPTCCPHDHKHNSNPQYPHKPKEIKGHEVCSDPYCVWCCPKG